MDDKIEITCPRCGQKWEQSLSELENIESIFKTNGTKKNKKNIVKVRGVCPNDGTYIVIEVQED